MRNFYAILDVTPAATSDVIQSAYQTKVMQLIGMDVFDDEKMDDRESLWTSTIGWLKPLRQNIDESSWEEYLTWLRNVDGDAILFCQETKERVLSLGKFLPKKIVQLEDELTKKLQTLKDIKDAYLELKDQNKNHAYNRHLLFVNAIMKITPLNEDLANVIKSYVG